MHPFGRFESESYGDIGRTAAVAALDDAGLKWSDIGAAYVSSMYLPATSGARVLKPLGETGVPICNVEAACASGAVALLQAIQSIRAGSVGVALVLGVEKMPRGFMDPSMIYEPWQIQMGLCTNPSYWALRARRHMHEFGTTEEQIARVAYKNHRNSVRNPYAMYRKEFSMEEILASPLVCDPIRLLEICAPNEGAAAVVVAAGDTVKSRQRMPVIAACVHTIAAYAADWRGPMAGISATAGHAVSPTTAASRRAYEESGIGPDQIDCFEVQDTDAFCELEAYEELGLCGPGESGKLVESGATEIRGQFPVSVSGGLISKGEPVGASHLGQLVELVWQLRGEAGERQVQNAKTGLAHVLGVGGNCGVTIIKV
jgi:acetyl-CoA acetyltransferase